MKKFISGIMAVATLALALACGGSDSTSGGTASIAGAIDSSAVGESVTSLEVVAVETANTSMTTTGTITAGTNGEDHTYVVSGLKSGTEYTIVVNRVIDNDPFTNTNIELVSTVLTADTSTGELNKGRAKTKRKRQINAATSFVAKRYAAQRAAGKTLADVVSSTFGSTVTDLSSLVSVNGALSLVNSSALVAFSDPVAELSVSIISNAAKQAATLSVSEVQAQVSNLASVIETVTTATSLDVFTSISTSLTVLAPTLSSALTSVTTIVNYTVSLAVAQYATFGQTVPATYSATIQASTTVTVDTGAIDTLIQEEQSKLGVSTAVKVTSFDLADASYGTVATDGTVTLYSLAPVFKITLATAPADAAAAKAMVGLKLKTSAGNESDVTESNATIAVDGADVYVLVHNKQGLTNSSTELKPGATYTYTIAAKTGYTLSGVATQGTINVADVTFTFPFAGPNSDDPNSAIKLGSTSYQGVLTTSDWNFEVNSSVAIAYDSTAADKGLLSLISVSTGTSGFTSGAVSFETNTDPVSSTGFILKLKGGTLVAGNNSMTATVLDSVSELSGKTVASPYQLKVYGKNQ